MKEVTNIGSYDSTNLVFYVNGKQIEEKDVDPKMTLAAYLRDNSYKFDYYIDQEDLYDDNHDENHGYRKIIINTSFWDYFVFHSPSTPERIRMACEDFVTSHEPPLPEEGSYTPWTASV